MAFDFDVLIVGSGMGASVAAKRFCEAPINPAEGTIGKVAMVEMGEAWHTWNGSSYVANTSGTDPSAGVPEQSQDLEFLDRLIRDYPADWVQTDPKLVVVQGMGLGGGSLVYGGVHLRAPSAAFAFGWPSGYTRANLDSYYARVESFLGIAPDPETFNYRRPAIFKRGVSNAGLGTATPAPLAMSGCTRCGWCVPICVFDKKVSMPLSYLRAAKATGTLSVYLKYKATDIQPLAGGGYRVRMLYAGNRRGKYHLQAADGDPTWDGTWHSLSARRVIIAAGAMESPCILQRSKSRWGLSIPSRTGQGIDGTGDGYVAGILPASTPTDVYQGAVLMALVDRGDYVLEEANVIPVAITAKYPLSFNDGARWSDYGLDFKKKMQSFGSRLLGIIIVGKSPSGGNISVADWNATQLAAVSNTPYQLPTGALSAAQSVIAALGGELAKTPGELKGQSITAHPTGGCKMGDFSSSSIVNKRDLEVWGYPKLHVIDGSVIPSSVFRNPAHTILAVAEKACDAILGPDPGW